MGTIETADTPFKTTPFDHQRRCLTQHGHDEAFALFAEMGTGKSWIIINNAAYLWCKGLCDAVLVFAPNGVQENWTRLEIPFHLPDWVPRVTATWSSANNKAERQKVQEILPARATNTLRILSMNWEALAHRRSLEVACTFARSAKRLMIVADESDEIGNPKALRTKGLMSLKKYTKWRRILTGTPIDGTPFSAFSQFRFLDEAILGTDSYTAFKAEYAEMLDKNHPLMAQIVKRNPRAIYAQIVAKDALGRPKYRNLDKLRALMAPYTFRVLKKDCLDLPAKLPPVNVFFDLTKEQRAIYTKAETELRLAYEGNDTPFNRLAIATKLAQITSGYFLHPMSTEPVRIPGDNPKIDLLCERAKAIVAAGHKFIVWARYQIEIDDILVRLRREGITCVRYDGQVKKAERTANLDAFEHGDADGFVGNQQAGGRGLTLVAASFMMYFSNNFRLRDRLQSEDRAHRIGQKSDVTYLNLVAKDTIDEAVVKALMEKKDVADLIVDGRILA